MGNKWFKLKEQGAGEKRLELSWRLYKIFGAFPLRIIAFFVATTVFLTAKERRQAAENFFTILNKYTNKNYSVLFSSYKLFINYANSLVDKIISFSGKMKATKFVFADEKERQTMYNTIDKGHGAFFIITHVGNIEILRSLLMSGDFAQPVNVNIFFQTDMCETFNKFLKKAEIKTNVEILPVENINIDTSLKLSEKLKNGELSFIAGDRISAQNANKTFKCTFLGRQIELPVGAFRFALLMESPVFFIVCAKSNRQYKIHVAEFISHNSGKKETLEDMKRAYRDFLEKYTLLYPHQFYNFFDIFVD